VLNDVTLLSEVVNELMVKGLPSCSSTLLRGENNVTLAEMVVEKLFKVGSVDAYRCLKSVCLMRSDGAPNNYLRAFLNGQYHSVVIERVCDSNNNNNDSNGLDENLSGLFVYASKSTILDDAVKFVESMIPPMNNSDLDNVKTLCFSENSLMARILMGCESESTSEQTKTRLCRISTGLCEIVLDEEFDNSSSSNNNKNDNSSSSR